MYYEDSKGTCELAGASTAAGICYGGKRFTDHFAEFIEKYGKQYMTDMYAAGFYPFPTEEAKWGYWSKHALMNRFIPPALPMYLELTYDAEDLFRKMDASRKDCLIPTELVPKCPVCGGRMTMHLRCDNYFVEDESWHAAADRYADFLEECKDKKVVLLELGV